MSLTSSDAGVLAQLVATFFLASAVTFPQVLRRGHPLKGVLKLNAAGAFVTFVLAELLFLTLMAAGGTQSGGVILLAYGVAVLHAVLTATLLWGVVDVHVKGRPL